MNPAWSVVFLTTLIGAGQGLFAFGYVAELLHLQGVHGRFFVTAGALAVGLTALGLLASFFHLGRPERAWRAAAMWRTSWLSREVIALPAFGATTAAWTLAHVADAGPDTTALLGAAALLACAALFVCTGMVYASIRFLQEWASPLTLVNFTLLGLASGGLLATALAALLAPALVGPFGAAAAACTVLGLGTRAAALWRNARIKPRSTLQTAIGVRHPVIRQRAMGFMGGSFNTREFFHGRSPGALRQVKWAFLLGAFVLPLGLLGLGMAGASAVLLGLAFAVQYAGLLAERWFFLAQANHPQNLYYQAVS
jgi:sulfite dehydrogenase (quinone) subunit SoeC